MANIELKISSTLEEARLASIAGGCLAKAFWIYVTGESCSEDNRFISTIELAVGEACVNSVVHKDRQADGDQPILVRFKLDGTRLEVEVRDTNKAFDFYSISAPDPSDLPESGYGIHIMKEAVDDVCYHRKNGWNIITLTKCLQQEDRL